MKQVLKSNAPRCILKLINSDLKRSFMVELPEEQKWILIVVDDNEISSLLEFYLRRKGINATMSSSIKGALRLIKIRKPDMIVADAETTAIISSYLNDDASDIKYYDFSTFNEYASNLPPQPQETLLDEFKKLIDYIKKLFRF